MNKKILKIVVIIVASLLIIFAIWYFLNKKAAVSNFGDKINTEKMDLLTDAEIRSRGLYHLGIYQVTEREKDGTPKSYQLVSLKNEEPIVPEFMTEAEKSERGLDSKLKIQVLEREADNKITAYKIIKKDSDIVKKY